MAWWLVVAGSVGGCLLVGPRDTPPPSAGRPSSRARVQESNAATEHTSTGPSEPTSPASTGASPPQSHIPAASPGGRSERTIAPDCTIDGRKLYGKVEIVDAFPDFEVQVVDAFPDLKVQEVDAFPDSCGKWKFVDAFPDLKVKFVKSFPDFKIKKVDAFPGLP